MILAIYKAGYDARHAGQNYDPMGSDKVCEASETLNRFKKLAEQVADGNFNQKAVIAEARALISGVIE